MLARLNAADIAALITNSTLGLRMDTAAQTAASLGIRNTGAVPMRDYNAILGYKQPLVYEDYFSLFERGDVATTIITEPAWATWQRPPIIRDASNGDTPFTTALKELNVRHRIWRYLFDVDRDAGICNYALLLIGTAGTTDLASPAVPATGAPDIEHLLYLRVLRQNAVTSYVLNENPFDSRFGKPEYYICNLDSTHMGVRVHHSRVLHVCQDANDGINGTPRLQSPWNRIQDLHKLISGSAEAAWQTVDKGRVFDIKPDYDLPPDEEAKMEQQIDEYRYGMRRFLLTRGVTVSDLGAEVVDPTGLFMAAMRLISATTRIPLRILLGSEAGQLASSTDESTWAKYVRSRRTLFAEPDILRPFLKRMTDLNIIPAPATEFYTVRWHPIYQLSDTERAQVARTYAAAIRLIMDNPTDAFPVSEFRKVYMNLPETPDASTDSEVFDS